MKSNMTSMVFLLVVAILLLSPSVSLADVPHSISYQGKATLANGSPVADGVHNFQFRLFGDSLTGTQLWSNSTSLQTTAGLFSTFLFFDTESISIFEGLNVFLEVSIDGETITPRSRIHSVPYAIHSRLADQLQIPFDMTAFNQWCGVFRGYGSSNYSECWVGGIGEALTGANNWHNTWGKVAAWAGLVAGNDVNGIFTNLAEDTAGLVSVYPNKTQALLVSHTNAASFKSSISPGGANGFAVRVENTHPDGGALFVKNASTDASTVLENTGSGLVLKCFGTGYVVPLAVNSNGRVGIGTINPNYTLDVRGSIGNNTTLYHSDIRWKKNVSTLGVSIDDIRRLRGVEYEWKRDEFADMNFPEGIQIGLIAQEVEEVFPQVVATNEEGYKSVDYSKLVAVLVEINKQQQDEIEHQHDKIEALQNDLTELKKIVTQIAQQKVSDSKDQH